MHLFAARPGASLDDSTGIIDLEQTPAELVILSGADSMLSLLARISDRLAADYPSLRLVNTQHLAKPAAFDLWQDSVLDTSTTALPHGPRVILLSLLGGTRYWQYGLEALQRWTAQHRATLIVVPGEDVEDQAVLTAGTVSYQAAYCVWRHLREGGAANARQLFALLLSHWLRPNTDSVPPLPAAQRMPSAFCHEVRNSQEGIDTLSPMPLQATTLLLVIYRSHIQAADTHVFDALADTFVTAGFRVITLAVTSLKQSSCLALLEEVICREQVAIIVNTTGFAIARAANDALSSRPATPTLPLRYPIPVLQATLASTSEEDWQRLTAGLCSRDIAMQVALPELDGRIITRAIGFKAALQHHERTQYQSIRFELHAERARFVAELARNWCQLRRTQRHQRRIMVVLANYPADEASIGSGIGLDTPASTVGLLNELGTAGYRLEDPPVDAASLMALLQSGTTNTSASLFNPVTHHLTLTQYRQHYAQLPVILRGALERRWGTPEQDPRLVMGATDRVFPIAVQTFGHVAVGIQPMRGYAIDQMAHYHDTDLIPPHSYLAFYFWIRHHWQCHAVVHMGTHGNLEWLPGKGMALSAHCWPEVALGPLPNVYPFIVNDPGEGAQAKRRTQAVLIGHLTPPMMQADIHGHLAELERLMDEYYQALNVDPQRERYLREQILRRARDTQVIDELMNARRITAQDDDSLLIALDGWLCDIKECQVKNGLHILGKLPRHDVLIDQLLSLLRIPRTLLPSSQENSVSQHCVTAHEDQGLLHALATDLQLGASFDPLGQGAAAWQGPRPALLQTISSSSWRTEADTRERLNQLARQLIQQQVMAKAPDCQDTLPASFAVLQLAHQQLLPALQLSVHNEFAYLLAALDGQAIPPGASGSPARGRWDILPTGRNMYTLDSRAIPSPTAWVLGQQAAEQLIERYLQEHGDYPQWIGITLWGTATLRTGGDDIAQALALLGVKPIWAAGSTRIVDIAVIPAFQLGRPRVDVTLRISGFFRDAFPNLIVLLDRAICTLADYAEPGRDNLIRAHVATRQRQLIDTGHAAADAWQDACQRVFGPAEGHYGSGLAPLLAQGQWQDTQSLAQAYIEWGGYAWRPHANGEELRQHSAQASFAAQLGQLDAVVHNRDAIEQDVLDATDHAQFQGGMANATYMLRNRMPALYVGDHTLPGNARLQGLTEAVTQTLHARILNPRWQAGMRRHGYKGANELIRGIDSLVAFDATTQVVADHQYAQVAASLLQQDNQLFIQQHNPAALHHLIRQLLMTIQQGLWQAPEQWQNYLENRLIELEQRDEEHR